MISAWSLTAKFLKTWTCWDLRRTRILKKTLMRMRIMRGNKLTMRKSFSLRLRRKRGNLK